MRLLTAFVLTLFALVPAGCAGKDSSAGASTSSESASAAITSEQTSEPTAAPASVSAEAPPPPFKGLPDGVEGTLDSPAGVVVPDKPGTLWVVTYGSGSNPILPHEVSADDQVVTVVLAADESRPSTMDYVPTTSTIAVPESIDPAQPVVVVLGDLGQVDVDLSAPGTVSWVAA